MKQIEQEKQVLNSLNSLLYDLHYSLAIDAAYKGDYSLSGSYIMELIKQYGEKPVLLDLNAKINAQQGNFKQAEFLWQKCLKIEPENRAYIAALARLHKIQHNSVSININKIGLISGAVFISLLIIFIINSLQKNENIHDELTKLSKQQNDIFIYLNEHNPSQQANISDSLLISISQDIEKIEGIIVHRNSNELIIHFENGLFNNSDHLFASQKSVISSLAKVLEPFSDRISVLILGCTDDMPITDSSNYKSNNALSIARASEVYDIFYSESRFLINNLKIGSGIETDIPYPNDNEENKLKNRTTVIKLFPK